LSAKPTNQWWVRSQTLNKQTADALANSKMCQWNSTFFGLSFITEGTTRKVLQLVMPPAVASVNKDVALNTSEMLKQ
jgi:hypothetical protein